MGTLIDKETIERLKLQLRGLEENLDYLLSLDVIPFQATRDTMADLDFVKGEIEKREKPA